ncbi:MAG: SRPBCC family protein [Acidobacteriota bacterium]
MSTTRSKSMQHYEIEFWLDEPLERVWEFFTNVNNLTRSTPDWLDFAPDAVPARLDVGVDIDYRLRWRGLPLRWTSRIVDWQPMQVFTYEQRRGPYRHWRHEHYFEPEAGGVRVVDRVYWRAWGGRLVRPWVARDVARIFSHRVDASRSLLHTES